MRNKRFLVVLSVFLVIFSVAANAREYAYSTISIDEIASSLPDEPITIGLDVDDTVMFSSPGFYYAFTNTDGPNNTNKYGKNPLKNDMFWQDMSCKFDKFSMPKNVARELLAMHSRRGDTIYFITARPAVKGEILTDQLHREFKLVNQPKAIFSGKTSKSVFIRKHNISIFYGDSDSDIKQAHDAGVRGIRVLRSKLSNNKGKYNPGIYGEAVLENSAD